MGHEGDLFACSPAIGKLVNTINTNYKNSLCSQWLALFQIYNTIPFHLALGNHYQWTCPGIWLLELKLDSVYTPIQSIAYKELSFEIGLWLQIKKLQKTKTKTLYASKEENEMSKSKIKISTQMCLRHVIT